MHEIITINYYLLHITQIYKNKNNND